MKDSEKKNSVKYKKKDSITAKEYSTHVIFKLSVKYLSNPGRERTIDFKLY